MSLKTSDKIFLKYPLYMLKYVKPYVQKCLYTVHIDISYKLNNFIQNNFYKTKFNCYARIRKLPKAVTFIRFELKCFLYAKNW